MPYFECMFLGVDEVKSCWMWDLSKKSESKEVHGQIIVHLRGPWHRNLERTGLI